MIDKWSGCYDDGWHGDIVPEAFSHPAKFSHGLIHRIYLHAKEMGWVKPGDWVLDPFGGVALGGLDALAMGLNWVGVELEAKFVSLGEQNIELWQRQLKGWPNLGTARIVQGDSRRLKDVIIEANLIVSSPPYAEIRQDGGSSRDGYKGLTNYSGEPRNYWRTQRDQNNLGNMPEGSLHDVLEQADIVISSPPFCDKIPQQDANFQTPHDSLKRRRLDYGSSPGQLGSMKEGSIDAVISSPPYESSQGVNPSNGIKSEKPRRLWDEYDVGSKENLGNSSGDTFWSASREIVQQCFDLLKPGGHAIWVCKDYVKNKKRVPFSDRWQALCESVGFKLVCCHQSMLVKEHGTQTTIHGDEKITTERKSFFRRLAESKGSPRIDWEDILCLVKQKEN